MDPIEALAREDKWYLGCGDGIIFAPAFPVWLDAPGFWDEATIYQYQLAPLFTVTLVAVDGREIRLTTRERRWTPAELTVKYEVEGGGTATETRTVQPGGVFASEWALRDVGARVMHAVAWTVQDTASLDLGATGWNGSLGITRIITDRRHIPFGVRMELASVGAATSWSATLSERSAIHPHWRFAPFAELWRSGELPRAVRLEGVNTEGLLYGAVHLATPVATDRSFAFAMRLTPADDALRSGAPVTPLGIRVVTPARDMGRTPSAGVGTGGAGSGLAATAHTLPMSPLARASRRRWHEFFDGVPHFTCSDPYLERYYWYRWYGLWLNSIAPGTGNYHFPTVCEGIGFFHQPITYSAQCHVRELRWMHDPERARGVLRTIFAHQRDDGSLNGRVYVNHLNGTDFYHANWGDAFLALDALHPDDEVARELYPRLARHAEWLVAARDADNTGMIDVVDQYETGQEYMSRYQAVDANADAYGWENRIRLKGIDVTVYAYALFTALSRLASRVGASDEVVWSSAATRTRNAVRERMWNAERGMFSDVDPRSGQRTDVAAAVCFYPYFTDLATEEHLAGFERNLLDPERFWTNYPVPSSALDDPLFSAVAEWKGKRHVCPWNGRVWPMTNSHIVEALGRWATPERPALREACATLLHRYVRMMFHDGDLARPNCFEHYNPQTGAASMYRGIDDYQHSWVADLIIQYVCGVRVIDGTVVVDPMPMALDRFHLRGVHVAGLELEVRLDGNHVTVTAGDRLLTGVLGQPIIVSR